jgi:hypothetical protein
MNIIKILIKDRRERPNVRLYAAMLHSFVNPEEGTAGKIRKVLEEMGEAGVDLDAGGCHAVLEVCIGCRIVFSALTILSGACGTS